METTRTGFTIPKTLDEMMGQEAKRQKRRKADIMREALGEYLKARGWEDVQTEVEYGGDRRKDGE